MPLRGQADGPRGRPRTFNRPEALLRALELFWEHGYEGTTISGLTTAIGISPPSLYAAFGSKEELFREAVAYYNDPSRSLTAQALDQPTARQVVEAMLRDNARAYVDPESPRGCLIALAAHTYSPDTTVIRDLLTDLRRQDADRLRERLERATTEGDLPEALDTGGLAAFVVTVLHGLSIQARDGADAVTLTAAVDVAMLGFDEMVRRAGDFVRLPR